MFGSVGLKTVFCTPFKRVCTVRLTDVPCHSSSNVVVSGRFIYLLQDNTIQFIVKLPSNVTSCCTTDSKAKSSLNTERLFCSTDDGRIFALQLGSYLCQITANSHSAKPLHVEITDENSVLELPNIMAMKSVESRMAVLFKSTESVSVALYTVSDGCSTLSEPRIHQLYMHKESELTADVLEFTIITPASFRQKSSSQCCYSSGILDISDDLFNVLFGLELNLSRSPVLLLRGNGGLVLWLPVKSVVGTPASVQVLCSLGDSLVRVLTNRASPSSSQLLLIGHHGHILVISLSSVTAKLSYLHFDILGPVRCCTFFDNSKLLYSTDNELYIADVINSVQSGQSGSIKSLALGLSGVTALSAVRASEKNNTAALVLAAMSDGRIVELEIDSNVVGGGARTRCHIDAVQTSMSNFLSNIGQTGECLERVKLDSETKDSILEQLAIAGLLRHNPSASLIQCDIVASFDEFLTPQCHQIIARVSNRASFALGCSWTFVVSALPSSKCSCECHIAGSSHSKSCNTHSHSLYASCDVSGLASGASESLPLMLQSDELLSWSHIIQAALIYTPVNQLDESVKQISVPLTTQVVDILDFVQLASLSAESLCSRRRRICFASECRKLQQLCRPQFCDESDSLCLDEPESKKNIITSVKEHVISLYASKSSNIQDLTADRLLSVLLGNVSSDIGCKVCLTCPEGQTVTVEVMSSVDDGYQLILHSYDLHILIAVRLALLNRLEKRALCAVTMKPAAASAATYQHLRSRLDDVRDSISFGTSKQIASKQIVALYGTLRGSHS